MSLGDFALYVGAVALALLAVLKGVDLFFNVKVLDQQRELIDSYIKDRFVINGQLRCLKNELKQQRDKSARLHAKLMRSRAGCKKMADVLRAQTGADK